LTTAYPDAKVLLSVCLVRSWLKSIEVMIFPTLQGASGILGDPRKMKYEIIKRRTFEEQLDNRE
jgi:hypothetical protein